MPSGALRWRYAALLRTMIRYIQTTPGLAVIAKKSAVAACRCIAGISGVLELHGGRCLADAPDALGAVPVETTVAGIKALAASKHVKAILEDQPVSLPSL